MASPMRPAPTMPTRSLVFAIRSILVAIVAPGGFRRDITLGNVTPDGRAVALLRIAVTAAAGALQQKTLAGAQFVTAGRRRFALVLAAEMNNEAAAAAGLAAADAIRRKFRPVVAAHHGRVLEEFIDAPEREPAAELAGATGILHQVEFD